MTNERLNCILCGRKCNGVVSGLVMFINNVMSNLTLAKDSQAMISYKLFSHLGALEPIIRMI